MDTNAPGPETPDLPDPLPPDDPEPLPEPDPAPLPGPIGALGVASPLADLRARRPRLRLVQGERQGPRAPGEARTRRRSWTGGPDHRPAA